MFAVENFKTQVNIIKISRFGEQNIEKISNSNQKTYIKAERTIERFSSQTIDR